MKTLAERHHLISETTFHLKKWLLTVNRGLRNLTNNTQKFTVNIHHKDSPVIAVSDSELWNADDNELNWVLTAGKVQNLRLAAQQINGLEIPANQIFSFWKHIGNPNFGKGYVIGREIREGCIVPTIAGGLCQLSNALYDAALKADFEIIERHKHTQVIKGSLAEQDKDATVKWNYLDLRFKSPYPFRIEVSMTADRLTVTFKGNTSEERKAAKPATQQQFSKLNDCYSCGNYQCFKHPNGTETKRREAITTFILDDKWPEFDAYVKSITTDKDFFIVPLRKSRWIKAERYKWSVNTPGNVGALTYAAIKRTLNTRFAKAGANVFALSLKQDEKMAKAAAKLIPIESTHLIISQNLLPFLWQQGALGGRTFDVLITRMPMEKLHERLDFAHRAFPDSSTLNDFRAPQILIDLENSALTKAAKIITPHAECAAIFNHKASKLDWVLPKVDVKSAEKSNRVLFPASALGRKGAYEMRRLAKELNLVVIIAGKATEHADFWGDVRVEFATGNLFDNIAMVIYPVYVEHQPRMLLRAIATGLPVVTTTACGLSPTDDLTILPVADYDALKQAVMEKLNDVPASAQPTVSKILATA